jgi:putative membrane protein
MIGLSEILVIFTGIVLWIPIIVLACLGIKHLINRKKTCEYEGKSALDIAKERYVKGEITKEEYEEMKNTLISM